MKRVLILTTGIATVWASSALAQTAPAGAPHAEPAQPAAQAAPAKPANSQTDPSVVGEVVVTGQVLAEHRAALMKEHAHGITDNLSSNEAGSLPDFGLGQALKRLPGISMVLNNGRGEEQYITVRGFAPDYISTTIDGIQFPGTELGSAAQSNSFGSGRNPSFDVIPTAIAKSVNVYKTWSPDLPADAIGGVVNLNTRSAFDVSGSSLSGSAEYSDWTEGEHWHPYSPSGEGELNYTNRFGPDDHFGIVLSGTYYRRASASWDVYSGGVAGDNFYAYNPTVGGIQTLSPVTLTPSANVTADSIVPQNIGWLNYDDIRTRESLLGKLEYDDGSTLKMHLTGGYFSHNLNEDRTYNYLKEAGPTTLTGPDQASYTGASASAEYDKYIIERQITYLEYGAEYRPTSDLKLDATVNWAHSSYNQFNVSNSFTYNQPASSLANTVVAPGNSNTEFTLADPANFTNPANYNLAYHNIDDNHMDTYSPTFRFDAGWREDPSDQGFGVKVGALARDFNVTGWNSQLKYDPLSPVTMAALGPDTFLLTGPGNGQPMLNEMPGDAASYFQNNPNLFKADAGNLAADTIGNYRLDEQTFAGYAMATYTLSNLYVMAGVRYEHTNQLINNYLPSSFVSSSTATIFTKNNYTTAYAKLLPAVDLTYNIADDLKLRAGYSETIARADPAQLAQNSSLTVTSVATPTSAGVASQNISNPYLKPRESQNYDLSLEYYPGHGAVLSAGLFRKDISNEIVVLTNTQTGVVEPGQVGVYSVTTTQSKNAGPASVEGAEFNAILPSFFFLPEPFRAFGVSANATFTDQDASYITMSDGVTMRHLPQLIASPKEMYNVSLLYSDHNIDGRLAYNFTGAFPYSFSTTNAAYDGFYAGSGTLDLQLRYHLNSHVDVVFEAQNLTDTNPSRYIGAQRQFDSELLVNGQSFFFGVDFKL